MNPSSGEVPQFELPSPPSEQAPAAPGQAQERARRPEHLAAAPERASAPPAMLPSVPAAAQPASQPAAQATQGDDNSTTKSTKKPLLEDTDLIEKEWVNRAKRIVEKTRNDPHKQSEELTVAKADYMKQHYGKTIKASE